MLLTEFICCVYAGNRIVSIRLTSGKEGGAAVRKEVLMYARVLWGKIKMGMWDEYERYYDQKIISSTDGVKGFRGRRLLRSLENPDEGISISLWETKEDMENYVKSTRRQELARDAEKLYSGEYWVKHFEVKSSNVYLLGLEILP